jgi:energy-coupling factor transporter ATP-binding protein EcfA2
MGSRGTGKSTLLYFIKSILNKDGENDKTTYNILKNNLGPGIIELTIEGDDGQIYTIEKSLNDEPQPKDSNGKHVSINNLYDKIQCDIYEALAIERIGLDSYSRLELIDKMIENKIEIQNKIKACQNELKQNAIDVMAEKTRLNNIKEMINNFENAEEELSNHKNNLPAEVSKEENENFKKKETDEKIRRTEKKYIADLDKLLNESKIFIDKQIVDCNEKLDELKLEVTFLNKELLNKSDDLVIAFYENWKIDLVKHLAELNNLIRDIGKIENQLDLKHQTQHNEFITMKQRFENNKEYYDKYEKLSKRLQEKELLLKEKEKTIKKLAKHNILRSEYLKSLSKYQEQIYNERLSRIKELNKYLKDEVIITITKGGLSDEYNDKLKVALKGSGMKYSIIGPKIIDNFKPNELADIINNRRVNRLKTIFGVDIERAEDLINALSNKEEIYEIESLNCPDLVEFKLRIDSFEEKNKIQQIDYRKTDELSTGQRCTAVLPIIFAVSNNPLIIDQPEDNLDNKYITKTIHEIIGKMKKQRQIIFITHNANIPVLSESEQNFFLTFEKQQSFIKDQGGQGTVEDVKESILKILEGGKEAFKMREKKYNELLNESK